MIDPQFTRELEYRKNHSQPPVEAEVRVLLRRKRPNYIKIGLKRSAYLHLSLLGLMGMSMLLHHFGIELPSLFLSKKDLSKELSKKAIRVDVVDLPTLKLSELAKVDLTKDPVVNTPKPPDPAIAEAEAKAKAQAEAQAKAKAKEQAAKDQMILAEKNKKALSEKQKLAASKKKQKAEAEELKHLQDLQKSLSQDYQKQDASGKPGREVLAGNIKSEGYAVTGDIATQRDAFQAEVRKHFYKFWNAPGWMKASGKFSTKILVRLAPDGRVLSQEFLERSGSAEYDDMASKAVADASPFPKPPADLLRNVMEDGLVCGFPE